MSLPEQVFNDVTPAQFDTICKIVHDQCGITISELTGEGEKQGVGITWKYDHKGETLTLQCVKKPWIVPASMVQQKIKDAVEAALNERS